MGDVDDVVLGKEGFLDTPWYAFHKFIKYTRTILNDWSIHAMSAILGTVIEADVAMFL